MLIERQVIKPIFDYLFKSAVTEELKAYGTDMTVNYGATAEKFGIKPFVEGWMKGYESSLQELELGIQEAIAHRKELFLGGEFRPEHGRLTGATSLGHGDDRGRYSYKFTPIETPDLDTTFDHVYRAVSEIFYGETRGFNSKQNVLFTIRDGHDYRWIILDDKWALDLRMEKKGKDRKFPALRMALMTLPDEELQSLTKARKREEEVQFIRERFAIGAIQEQIGIIVENDFSAKEVYLNFIRKAHADHLNILVETLSGMDEWERVEVDKSVATALQNNFRIDPDKSARTTVIRQRGIALESAPLIMTITENDEGYDVIVVVSNQERERNERKYIEKVAEETGSDINDVYTAALEGEKTYEMSPQVLVDNLDLNISDGELKDRIKRALMPLVVLEVQRYTPTKVYKLLEEWLKAYQEYGSLVVEPLGVVVFDRDGTRTFWQVNFSDGELSVRISGKG